MAKLSKGKVWKNEHRSKNKIVKAKRQRQTTKSSCSSPISKNEGLLVNGNELNWKRVDVPDTLDDFGGFYGLEELDGVDVKIVNGQAQFIVKDQSQADKIAKANETVKKQHTNVDEPEENESEGYEEDDLIEFKNFDDMEDGELTDRSSNVSDENSDTEYEDGSQYEEEKTNTDLTGKVFSADVEIDDLSSEDLEEWTKLAPLSMATLIGLKSLQFHKPTEIQTMAIPPSLQGSDIMGKASTGSGKTLAYGIPILEQLVKCSDQKQPIALIFTPTRELAQQVSKHLQSLSKLVLKNTPYAILSLTGGLSIQKQQRLLKYDNSGRIVIATPGRFLELLEKNLDLIDRFSMVQTLVLDEADRLLQDGHFEEFEKILKLLTNARRKACGKNSHWQTMIYSATFAIDLFEKLASDSKRHQKKPLTSEAEMQLVLQHIMQKIHMKSKPLIIDTNPNQKVSSQIKESLIECSPLERDLYCYYFVTIYPGKTLIFCNAIDSVKKLHAYLKNLDISVSLLHSSMTQKNRLKNLERFNLNAAQNVLLGKATVLIASDVAARGLDIPTIDHVIHYHLPRTADVYIHRSGRTARASSEGVSVMICSPQESMGPLRKLRKVLLAKSEQSSDVTKYRKNLKGQIKWQNTVPMLPIETDILAQLRERSRLASLLADNDLASVSLKKEGNWLNKAAEDLGIDVGSDDDSTLISSKDIDRRLKKTISKEELRSMRYRLAELLNVPIRKDMRRKYLTGGLTNLADTLIKSNGHNNIIGHDKVDALETLKKKGKR